MEEGGKGVRHLLDLVDLEPLVLVLIVRAVLHQDGFGGRRDPEPAALSRHGDLSGPGQEIAVTHAVVEGTHLHPELLTLGGPKVRGELVADVVVLVTLPDHGAVVLRYLAAPKSREHQALRQVRASVAVTLPEGASTVQDFYGAEPMPAPAGPG